MKHSMFMPAEADNLFSNLSDYAASMVTPEIVLFFATVVAYALLFKMRSWKEGHGKFETSRGVSCKGKCYDQIEELEVEETTDVLEELVPAVVEDTSIAAVVEKPVSAVAEESAAVVVTEEPVTAVIEESDTAVVEGPVATIIEESVLAVIEDHLKNQELDKAQAVVQNTADVAVYNLLFDGYVQRQLYRDGLRLLDAMSKRGVEPNALTRSILFKLLANVRKLDYDFSLSQRPETLRQRRIGQKESLPRLATVLARSAKAPNMCINEISMNGNLSHLKAVSRTFKKHGFVKKCNDSEFPMNGHWETEHGMNVIIDGKIVRWSQKRASKLKFVGAARESCSLSVYGDTMVGRLVEPTVTGASKTLRWESGEVWNSFGGCHIAHAVVYFLQMGKAIRDETLDEAVRKQTYSVLRLVSREGLGLLPNCLDQVIECIGNDSYHVNVYFESKDGPAWMAEETQDGFLGSVSRRHPQVGFRHCWADEERHHCGQRTVIQGRDVQEDEFSRLSKGFRGTGRRAGHGP